MTPEFCYPKYLPLLSTLVTYNLDKQAIEQIVTKAKYVARTLTLGDSNQSPISSIRITTLGDTRPCVKHAAKEGVTGPARSALSASPISLSAHTRTT